MQFLYRVFASVKKHIFFLVAQQVQDTYVGAQ
jgi:hypothetical protein